MSLPVGGRFPAVSVAIPEFNLGKQSKIDGISVRGIGMLVSVTAQTFDLVRRVLLYIQISLGAALNTANICFTQ